MKKFETIDDLGKWIDENVEDKNTYHEVMEAVYWFVAIREATNISEQYDLKDIAGMLLGGLPIIQNNREYVNDFINELYAEDEDCEEYDEDHTNARIEEMLRTHFNL